MWVSKRIYEATLQVLVDEIAALRKDNSSLLDRLMAKGFEQFKTYESSDEPYRADTRVIVDDDPLPGTMVDNETIS